MNEKEKVQDCFLSAKKYEESGRKHKGLLVIGRDDKKAEEYVKKAKTNLETCELYKERRLDYKIPEEWFYTLYYCALAILAKFGIESRNQRCTALFLRYVKEKEIISYDKKFIDKITVYSSKEEKSSVDEREDARYSSSVKNEEIIEKYDLMMNECREAISQCEDLVFSEKIFEVPEELRSILNK